VNLIRNNKDYIHENGVNARKTKIKSISKPTENIDAKKHHKLGIVPKYINEINKRKSEEENRIRELKNSGHREGYKLMDSKDRLETLQDFEKSKADILSKLNSLPIRNDTMHLRTVKENLYSKLNDIEEGIRVFSKSKENKINKSKNEEYSWTRPQCLVCLDMYSCAIFKHLYISLFCKNDAIGKCIFLRTFVKMTENINIDETSQDSGICYDLKLENSKRTHKPSQDIVFPFKLNRFKDLKNKKSLHFCRQNFNSQPPSMESLFDSFNSSFSVDINVSLNDEPENSERPLNNSQEQTNLINTQCISHQSIDVDLNSSIDSTLQFKDKQKLLQIYLQRSQSKFINYKTNRILKDIIPPICKMDSQESLHWAKEALLREENCTKTKWIGDYSKPYSLPTVPGSHIDLNYITPLELSKIQSKPLNKKIIIVDCRYCYEYEGGHIKSAINLYNKKSIIETLMMSECKYENCIIIFYCEFSSERAPKTYRFMREIDRIINGDCYPKLYFPELYIVRGGYKAFFNQYKNFCEPQNYTAMVDPLYQQKLLYHRKIRNF
ncbi:Cell division cycle-related protein 25.3, partial [Intoshia linei]